ncbi:hypothetical protein JCM10212_002054 [Sporobolomyces blumeae]
MTSLDPSHLPGLERTSNPRTGQAVKTSVSPLVSHSASTEPSPDNPTSSSEATASPSGPSWRGAWKRRQEAKLAERRLAAELDDSDSDSDDDDDDDDERGRRASRRRDQVPIPPIPDLRYEQGILSSIRPFLHPVEGAASSSRDQAKESARHELKVEAAEKAALATSQLTAERADRRPGTEQSEALMGPLRIEWSNVVYVLVRDQVVFPLLQGVLWGMAGIYLNGLWEWNRRRIAAKPASARSSSPSLLSRLGVSFA